MAQVSVSAEIVSPAPTAPARATAGRFPHAAQDPGGHQDAGDEADLAFQGPAGAPAHDRAPGALEGGYAAVEDVQVAHAHRAEAAVGVGRAYPGLTDQHG